MTKWIGAMRWSQTERGWFGAIASLPDGRALVRHEVTWRNTSPENAALDLKRKMREWQIPEFAYIVANAEIFPGPKSTGRTVSEKFVLTGLRMRQGDEDRINGWSDLRSWLEPRVWPGHVTSPSLLIHRDCRRLLDTLPTLAADKHEPDDIVQTPDEYPASALRCYVMSRPKPWEQTEPELPPDAIGHWVNELRAESIAPSYNADISPWRVRR